MNRVECQGLEKEILLVVHKKPKSISKIAKIMGKSIQTVSKTVERMKKQDIIRKSVNHLEDARVTKIKINPERIAVARTHTFYMRYFSISFTTFFIAVVASYVKEIPVFLLGAAFSALPTLIYMAYNVYVAEDRITVYKIPKKRKKKEKINQVDNADVSVGNG